mmetsp:Transcript_6561/g.19919  ORF Transcript_6561/g.19919 Transcript_6561/m.19919 type:complete len:226 (+) Transcript_6561:78-755(+)
MKNCSIASTLLCIVFLTVVSCFFSPVSATSGVDVSEACLPSGWSCLKSKGYDFAVVRAWRSNGAPDTNAPHTIYNAWDGGMAHVDVYLFPCTSCGDPAGQMKSAIQYLQSYNCKWGTTWLDIEGPGQYWGSNQAANQQFFESMAQELESLGMTVGVYTSASQWEPIMGSSYTGGSRYPLWYAHYDNNPSFSDFQAFGGWSSPAIKQYQGNVNLCGCGTDLNWYPN